MNANDKAWVQPIQTKCKVNIYIYNKKNDLSEMVSRLNVLILVVQNRTASR